MKSNNMQTWEGKRGFNYCHKKKKKKTLTDRERKEGRKRRGGERGDLCVDQTEILFAKKKKKKK